VSAIRQEGALARTHEGEPGLPRGRSRLPVETVRAAQRERLLCAVVAAVADTGYHDVTVADIVRRARVSRAAFYAHFAGKEDCFLDATRAGGKLMAERIVAATRALPAGCRAEDILRTSIAAYLAFLVEEPAFARAFYVEMPAAGARAVGRLEAAHHQYAGLNHAWHKRARRDNPAWPVVPYEACFALSGAISELVRAYVRTDRIHALRGLEDTLVAVHLAVLAARPWPDTGAAVHDTLGALRDTDSTVRDTGSAAHGTGGAPRETGAVARDTGSVARYTSAGARGTGGVARGTDAVARAGGSGT